MSVAAWLFLATTLALAAWIARERMQQRRRTRSGPPPLPEQWDLEARAVFDAHERRLYRQLREALPHHVILAKLPLVRLCQPQQAEALRFWYDLLGGTHVHFAICSAHGRVLAAIDLSEDPGALPGRAVRIKQSVLDACRIRYLRCPIDHLPSVPELQLLVPQQSPGSHRGPQPATSAAPVMAPAAPLWGSGHTSGRRRERAVTLWQDSVHFADSFFQRDQTLDNPESGFGPLAGYDSAVRADYDSRFGELDAEAQPASGSPPRDIAPAAAAHAAGHARP